VITGNEDKIGFYGDLGDKRLRQEILGKLLHATCARHSLLNVLAFTDQPPGGSVHCSRVNNVTNMSKKMLNGPQTLSVDRVITEN
jgi:hypothetical protein